MSKGEYLLRRLGLALIVILGVFIITFFLSRVIPGDPILLYAGPRTSPEQKEEFRRRLGLDQPLPIQFVDYVSDILQGDFGISLRTKRLITDDLKIFLPATLELVILAMMLALLIGIPLGVLSAARSGTWLDQSGRLFSISGVSIPPFWLALLLQLLFFSIWGLLPLGGRLGRDVSLTSPIETITGFYLIDAALTGNWVAWRDAFVHLILPVWVLALYPVGLLTRMTRASMMETLSQPFITMARTSGLPERLILFRLALKNAIIPTLTVMGLTFAYAITGSVFVEVIFSWPGLGSYITDAILSSDFQVIITVTLVMTVIYVLVNLTVDILQAIMDPRIQL